MPLTAGAAGAIYGNPGPRSLESDLASDPDRYGWAHSVSKRRVFHPNFGMRLLRGWLAAEGSRPVGSLAFRDRRSARLADRPSQAAFCRPGNRSREPRAKTCVAVEMKLLREQNVMATQRSTNAKR
jgi:hypothetical protein